MELLWVVALEKLFTANALLSWLVKQRGHLRDKDGTGSMNKLDV